MIRKRQAFCHTRAFWMFVGPAFILFTIFFLVPLALSIGLSLTNFDGWKKMDFIGFKNFIKILNDKEFYKTMIRTFVYTAVNLPFKVILPLLVATLVTSKLLKGTTYIRTVIYIPVLLSALVVGITINWMFGQEYGLINFLIQKAGGSSMKWALNPWLAMFVISFASNWASLGYYMILFIGGINNISKELLEAANVDGASKVQTFFKITLPLISPTIFIVLLLSTVNLLKEYALIQGISMGGPGTSTTYIIQYMFDQGFHQLRYGYASAVGILVSIIFIIITVIQFKFTKGGGEI